MVGRLTLIVVSTAIALFGSLFAPMFGSGDLGLITIFLSPGLGLMALLIAGREARPQPGTWHYVAANPLRHQVYGLLH